MRLFRRNPITTSPTKEEIARRDKTIDDINKEIEAKNFEKAIETAIKLIGDCEKRDAFGEALGNYLAAYTMILQGTDKISLSNYDKARTHLMRALEIYQLMEKDKKHREEARMKGAHALVTLATLYQFAGKYNEAVEACRKSLDIFRRYGDKEGMKNANTIFFATQGLRINEKINETLGFWDKQKSTPLVRCPKDGQRCPLPSDDNEGRKKCPLYKCPLEP